MIAPTAGRRLGEDLVVETSRDGTTLVVSVRGEVDIATAPLLRAVLEGLPQSRPRRVEVDLSEVTFLDSQGITCLVAGRRRFAAEGIGFARAAGGRGGPLVPAGRRAGAGRCRSPAALSRLPAGSPPPSWPAGWRSPAGCG